MRPRDSQLTYWNDWKSSGRPEHEKLLRHLLMVVLAESAEAKASRLLRAYLHLLMAVLAESAEAEANRLPRACLHLLTVVLVESVAAKANHRRTPSDRS